MNSHINLVKALAIGACSLGLILLAIWPIYQNASEILVQIGRKTQELEALNEKVAILSRLDPVILQERVEVIDKAVPPKKDVLLYLTSVDGLSRELGLTFGGLSLSPGEVTEATGAATKSQSNLGGLQALATDLKMSGNQESIYAFLRTIEQVLPLMQIKNVKVNVVDGDQYNLALSLAMLWAEPATMDVRSKITLFNETEDKYFQQLASYRRFEPAINFSPNPTPKDDLFAPFGELLGSI